MADIYKEKQWELDSAIDDLYAVASRYEDYKNEVNRFIDYVIDDEIAYRDDRNKLQERIDTAIEKLKQHKQDLDYEPWSIYQIEGSILFDLVNILKGSDK